MTRHLRRRLVGLISATSGREQVQQREAPFYSITSSVRTRNEGQVRLCLKPAFLVRNSGPAERCRWRSSGWNCRSMRCVWWPN